MAPSKNGKRAIEFVDLTQGDDNLSLDPQRRKVPRTELNDGVTNRERETSIDQDVEEDADDVIFFSQDGDNIATESYELYGVLQTKIVGIQYYNGHATIGEFVMIQREPSNPYDRNAIRVNNVRREQIGHIPRQTASKLASYMV